MHTAGSRWVGTRASVRAAIGSLLIAGLCACGPATPQASLVAATVAPAPSKPAASKPSAFETDDALAIALARDQAARAAREQTLRVQRQLVEQRRANRDSAQRGTPNERCIAGQKMRRVANGWVQAGGC